MAFGPVAQPAEAATGPGTQPKESWDKMQTFEYNIGRIAGGLELCRRYEMSREIQAIADLTPYGKLGMAKMRIFDGMRGCGGLAENAKSVLGDKEKLIEYMKIRHDCSRGDCLER
ncbi:MAG: hypothetical protein RH942_15005 [Kiloniellaceae bacterium]